MYLDTFRKLWRLLTNFKGINMPRRYLGGLTKNITLWKSSWLKKNCMSDKHSCWLRWHKIFELCNRRSSQKRKTLWNHYGVRNTLYIKLSEKMIAATTLWPSTHTVIISFLSCQRMGCGVKGQAWCRPELDSPSMLWEICWVSQQYAFYDYFNNTYYMCYWKGWIVQQVNKTSAHWLFHFLNHTYLFGLCYRK